MKNITYISASAGSGKTYELTERLKEAILSGKTKPEEVILTTFTKAAAAEFKEKAKAKFYEDGKVTEANRLNQALIGTVDSVSNVFVNKYWYLLGISPKQNVISEEDENVYVAESLSSLPTKEQNEFFNYFAETFEIPVKDGFKAYGIDYGFWKKDLKAIFDATRNYRIKDYKESIEASKNKIQSFTLSCYKLNFDKEELLSKLEAVEAIISSDRPGNAKETRQNEVDKFRKILNKENPSQIEIALGLYKMIVNGKYTTKAYQASVDYLSLEEEANKVFLSEDVRDLQFTYIEYLFEIAERWQKQYIEYKKEQHIVDYTDMEEYFLELISNEKYESVQDDIRSSYKYLFVDEFQDCSPTQIQIFDRLSELVEQSIWVGDYKQAIYGFRGSDTALVKAVTDRIEKMNGKPNDTLGTSHRSWPALVELNNAAFVPAFSDILREEEVALKPWDKLVKKSEESGKKDFLKCWVITEKKADDKLKQVASNIAKMIEEGTQPEDIAVLAYSNTELSNLAKVLKEYNIPTLVGDSDFQQDREVKLLNALLSLVVNYYDTKARATIAFLTERDFGTKEILESRFEDLANEKTDDDFLSEINLVKQLLSKREKYLALNVSSLVETLIIEMDLYNVSKSWEDSDNSENIFHTIIKLAKDYEEHSVQMSLPCTIYGFIEYNTTVKAKAAGISDGVQLFTFHRSKGLEWKNVILLSLDEDILDEKNLITQGIYGVNTFHEEVPTADNPYPPMKISVLPWLYANKKSPPENIQNLILEQKYFEEQRKTVIQEGKRLMYVAMTRPVESLILAANEENGLLRLKRIGMNVVDTIPSQNKADILGVGKNFIIENPCDMDGWKYKTQDNKIINLSSEKKELKKRDQQPSSCKSTKDVSAKIIFDSEKRITLKSNMKEMDEIGTCLHNIFCVLENNPSEELIEEIIKRYEMEGVLPVSNDILEAWINLEKFLSEKYGPKIKTYHELPFKHHYEGQIFTGSIDFIWETKDGVVLVDFKSYPGHKDDVVNPSHEHYVGMYTGQFGCYEKALTSAGKSVIAKVVYYHVLGVCVEII